MLHAVVLPSWGGTTEFADLRAAYDALPERTRNEIEGLEAEHYALHTRILLGDEAYTDDQKKAIPPAVWPLVQTHPGSGRKLLFVGVHAREIIGWPTAEITHATCATCWSTPRSANSSIRTHGRCGDLVMWDNRARCIAAGATTSRSIASCGARPSRTCPKPS